MADNPELLEIQEVATPKKKKKLEFPRWTKPLLLVFLICVALFAISQCRKTNTDVGSVQGLAKPSDSEASKISLNATPEYGEKLKVYGDQEVEKASKSGDSYVPPVANIVPRRRQNMGIQTPSEPKPDPKPEPIPTQPERKARQEPAKREVVRNVQPQQQDNNRVSALAGYIGNMIRENRPGGQEVILLNQPEGRRLAPVAPVMTEEQRATERVRHQLKAGDILFAINRLTLDSDSPGPAMVEIIEGPFKGSKVIGAFHRSNEHLTLQFTQLVLTTGTSVAIQAFAIDPNTDRTAVRSSVDNHYLERFGGLFASAFLEGFGDAVAQSGRTSYNSIYGSSSYTPKYDINQQLWMAAGKVGQRSANVFERRFDRVPTVTLNSGTDIGVLIISVKDALVEVLPEINKEQNRADGYEDSLKRSPSSVVTQPQGR